MTDPQTDLLHRPAPDLISEEVLTAMDRDGWTPTQVRELIASYRQVVSELELRRRYEAVDINALNLDELQAEGERIRAEVAQRTKGMVGR